MDNKIKGTKNYNKLYGNNCVISPNGKLMFRGNNKKIEWYLKRDLAEVVSYDELKNLISEKLLTDEDKAGTHIKLLFQPDGEGHSEDDEYYLSPKENICVVTGSSELDILTKHHVVPYCFRKHFPLDYKDRSSHDILLITSDSHYEYENEYAMKFKNQIAVEMGLPTHDEYSKTLNRKYPARSIASTILKHSDKMPIDALLKLMIRFETLTNIKATRWDMEEYLENTNRDNIKPWGLLIVENITDFQKFSERWRQHFLDSMNPQYMPKGWDVKKNISLYESRYNRKNLTKPKSKSRTKSRTKSKHNEQ